MTESVLAIPTLEEWRALTPEARADLLSSWSYQERARPLIRKIVEDFRQKYCALGITVLGEAIHHGGAWLINVKHPFIFDRRTLPQMHLGVWVHRACSSEDIPKEFTGAYIWSPPNFERFVDTHADEIRLRLGQPSMSRTEMLAALVGRPFEDFVAHCRESVRKGTIQPFE